MHEPDRGSHIRQNGNDSSAYVNVLAQEIRNFFRKYYRIGNLSPKIQGHQSWDSASHLLFFVMLSYICFCLLQVKKKNYCP